MINSLIKIPDNISTSFEVVDGNFILGAPEPTYQGLDQTYIGFYVPYYAKNLLLGVNGPAYEWEIGIGKVITSTIIDRIRVVKSSSNIGTDGFVQFTFGGTKNFSIYPNEYITNIAYNNVINATGTFSLENIKSTVLVDLSQHNADAYLPLASGNGGLLIDFKSYNRASTNSLTVIPSGSDTIDGLSTLVIDDNIYTSLISNGSEWVQLKNETNVNLSVEGIGLPQGQNLSLQYKVASGELGGSNIFAVNSGLFVGSSSTSLAQHILSNNSDTIINNKSLDVDFIVKGSGNKNLQFSSEGKLGLNIPSGYSPNALLHLISSNCDASIKIENRNNCIDSLPSLILNHRPTTLVSNNSTVGRVSYTAKNSAGTSTTFGDIRSKTINSTAGYTSGQLVFGVDDRGTLLDIISLDKDKVSVNINGSSLNINNSSIQGNYDANLNNIYCDNIISSNLTGNINNILYSNSSGLISSLPIDVNDISITGHNHTISDIIELSGTLSELYTYIDNSSLFISGTLRNDIDDKIDLDNPTFVTGIITPYVISSSLESVQIDLVNRNFVGDWTKNDNSILSADTSNPSFSGYLLTHNGNSIEWKEFNPYNYIFDGIDIKWNRYLNRNCNVLIGGVYVSINDTNILEEFSLGDTVKVSISGTNYLRIVENISVQNESTTLTIDESVPTIGSGTVFSVSKGGYLELCVDPITAPDISPKIILSSKPEQDTIFNSTKANLGFKIYGLNNEPVLNIGSSGNMIINGSLPQNDDTSLTVNGYLYADNLRLGSTAVPSGYFLMSSGNNNVIWSPQTNINDIDGGIIVFSGVGVV